MRLEITGGVGRKEMGAVRRGVLGEALRCGRECCAYVGQIHWVQVVKLGIKKMIPANSGCGIQPRTGLQLYRGNEGFRFYKRLSDA